MTKLKLAILLTLFLSFDCFSLQTTTENITHTTVRSGIGFGTILAIVLSWERNKSVLLAILHGIFSWLYVIYFVLTRKPSERR